MSHSFPFSKEVRSKKKLLFCFHHAGGSAAIFREWMRSDSPFEVIPVELPGKSTRLSEPYQTSMAQLIPTLTADIFELAGECEIYLFGHSMGAILAFQIAYAMQMVYGKSIRLLAVAGRQAPQEPNFDRYRSDMGDEKLLEELKRMDGTPKELLENEEVQKYILPIIKRDYALNESYCYNNEKIQADILVHSGKDDPDLNFERIEGWKNVTDGTTRIREWEGGHFFLFELEDAYFRELVADITAMDCGEEGRK